MTDVNESTKPSSSTPQFSLAILFLWISLVSIFTWVWITLFNDFGRDVGRQIDWFLLRYYFASALAIGTGLMAAVLIVQWSMRGKAWDWQPGHVLLLAVGVYELLTVLAIGIDNGFLAQDPGQAPFRTRIYLTTGLLQHVLITLTPVVCLGLIRFTRRWQFVLAMIVFQNLLVLLMLNPLELPIRQYLSFDVMSETSRVTRYVVPSVIFLVAVWDLIWHKRRDWLHWVGVVVALIYYTAWMNPMSWF